MTTRGRRRQPCACPKCEPPPADDGRRAAQHPDAVPGLRADHQVFIATTGEQALALCASQHPDLVLLDVEMPGMDGYEVCRRLKADAALRTFR